jgi:hypothetical protein
MFGVLAMITGIFFSAYIDREIRRQLRDLCGR